MEATAQTVDESVSNRRRAGHDSEELAASAARLGFENISAHGKLVGTAKHAKCPATTLRSHCPCTGIGRCRRFSSVFTSRSFRLQSLLLRAPNQQKAPAPGARTDVRETQEVEGLSFLSDAIASRQGGQPPKSQQSRLQSAVPRRTLRIARSVRAETVRHHPSVGSPQPDRRRSARRPRPECTPISPASSPQVKDVVQVDVRQ